MTGIYEDGTYLANNPDWHESDAPWKGEKIAEIIRRNGLAVKSIAEIGCGAGGVLAALAGQLNSTDIQFSGFEISPQAFELARLKSAENIRYFLTDALNSNEKFDIVMAIDVIEHVEDYFSFLRKIKTKGTYKIFHIPLDINVFHVLRPHHIMVSRASVGHIHSFNKEMVLAILKDLGFRVLDWNYTAISLERPQKGWKAALWRIPTKYCFKIDQDKAARVFGGHSMLVLAE